MRDKIGLPEYSTPGSAGMDLRACIDSSISLKPNQSELIPLGISIYIENKDYAAIIIPRSGLGFKHGIVMGNLVGLIDSDYQGELQVPIWNRSSEDYEIIPGSRIAQMVVIPVRQIDFEVVDEFSSTSRGTKGFGSSGTD